MALDFHISGSRKNAERQRSNYSLEVDEHERLLNVSRRMGSGSAMLERIADYYGDAEFVGKDVSEFLEQLRALNILVKSKSKVDSVGKLIEIFENAASTQQNVYVFCD